MDPASSNTSLITSALIYCALTIAIPVHAQNDVRVLILSTYDTNPFGLRDSWRDTIDSQKSDGERFEGIRGVSDVVTSLSVELRHRRKTRKGTKIDLRATGTYNNHSLNSHASYAGINVSTGINPKGPGEFELDFSWIPSRHRKNYRSLTGRFVAGVYSETKARLTYRRKLLAALRSSVFLKFRRKSYEAPFSNRDLILKGAGVQLDARLARRVHILFTGWYGRASTDDGVEFGISIDLSYNIAEGKLKIKADTGDSDFSIWLKLRRRAYTSSNSLDTSHHGRSDLKWKAGVDYAHHLSKKVKLLAEGKFKDKSSSRETGVLEDDVIPYRGFSLGVGLRIDL